MSGQITILFKMSTLNTTTSTTKPTLGASDVGKSYFETDTDNILVWDGSAWQTYNSDGSVIPFTTNAYAVSYDGTDDYHQVLLNATSTGGVLASADADMELTLSFWFKPSGGDIFGWQNSPTASQPGILLTPQSASGTTYKLYYAGAYYHTFSSSEIVVGSWNHLMITRTASTNTWSVFCNGNATPVDTVVQSGSYTNRANMTTIYFSRAYYGHGQNVFDDIAFWNSDKSSNLSTIYNSGTPGDLGSLSPYGWWRMGDNNSASNGAAAGTISNIGSTANDMTVGGGSPTYTTSVP